MTDDRQAGSASDRIGHEGTKARRRKVHKSIRIEGGGGFYAQRGEMAAEIVFSEISATFFHSV
jgi:hypothetical protein